MFYDISNMSQAKLLDSSTWNSYRGLTIKPSKHLSSRRTATRSHNQIKMMHLYQTMFFCSKIFSLSPDAGIYHKNQIVTRFFFAMMNLTSLSWDKTVVLKYSFTPYSKQWNNVKATPFLYLKIYLNINCNSRLIYRWG